MGGSPLRLFRLTSGGARSLDRALGGGVVSTPPVDALLDRLVDAGALHPVPSSTPVVGSWTSGDVTVVVPVRDHASELGRLLTSLRSDPCAAAGIVVVDDASVLPRQVDDAIDAAARAVPAGPPLRRLRRQVAGGPAAARNLGARSADTEFVAFVDADCVVTECWLVPLLGHLADPSVALVAPRVAPAGNCAAGSSELIRAYEVDHSPLDLGTTPARVAAGTRVSYVPSAAVVVRRSVFESLGGFEESMRVGEDVDLVWRLTADGHRARYEPTSVVRHEVRGDLRSWLTQRVAYGSSAAALDQRHPSQVAPVVMSPWSLAVWSLVAAGHPVLGAAVAAGTVARLRSRLDDLPAAEVLRTGVHGHLGAGRQLARAVLRVWWPVAVPAAVVSRRARRVVFASVAVEAAATWRPASRRGLRQPLDPLRSAVLGLLDDVAYGGGVWLGAARRRSLRALLPRLSGT